MNYAWDLTGVRSCLEVNDGTTAGLEGKQYISKKSYSTVVDGTSIDDLADVDGIQVEVGEQHEEGFVADGGTNSDAGVAATVNLGAEVSTSRECSTIKGKFQPRFKSGVSNTPTQLHDSQKWASAVDHTLHSLSESSCVNSCFG